MKFDKGISDKLFRVALRAMPFVPGPEIFDLVSQIARSQKGIDAQVNEALESIQKTSALTTRLEESLRERSEKLKQLQIQHEQLSQLTTIDAQQASALLKQVEETVGRNLGRERWIAFLINIAAGLILFVLGVVFSENLKTSISAAWKWISN